MYAAVAVDAESELGDALLAARACLGWVVLGSFEM